jgi:hypothetical protein
MNTKTTYDKEENGDWKCDFCFVNYSDEMPKHDGGWTQCEIRRKERDLDA